MNDNTQIDAATACRRYQESATPEMLIRFERELLNRFGTVPAHVIGPDECDPIWQAIMAGGVK